MLLSGVPRPARYRAERHPSSPVPSVTSGHKTSEAQEFLEFLPLYEIAAEGLSGPTNSQ